MAERTNNQVIFTLTAETAKLQAGLDRAEAMLRNFTQRTQRAGAGGGAGGLGGIISVAATMKAVDIIFKTSATVLENYSGSASNFSSLLNALGKTISENADELVRAIPIFGRSLSNLIKVVRGDAIAEAAAHERRAGERRGRAFEEERSRLARAFGEEAEAMRRSRAVEVIQDPREQAIARLELEKQAALKRVEDRFAAVPAGEQSRELRKKRDQLRWEIEMEFARKEGMKLQELEKKAAEEQKKLAEEKAREQEKWARETAEVESRIRQGQYKAAGDELKAQLEQIRAHYAERKEEARKAGQAELASRLEVLQSIEEAEARKAAAVKRAAAEEKKAREEPRGSVAEFAAGTRYAGGTGADPWAAFRAKKAAEVRERMAAWEERRRGVAMWGAGTGQLAGNQPPNRDALKLLENMLAGIMQVARNTAYEKPMVAQ